MPNFLTTCLTWLDGDTACEANDAAQAAGLHALDGWESDDPDDDPPVRSPVEVRVALLDGKPLKAVDYLVTWDPETESAIAVELERIYQSKPTASTLCTMRVSVHGYAHFDSETKTVGEWLGLDAAEIDSMQWHEVEDQLLDAQASWLGSRVETYVGPAD